MIHYAPYLEARTSPLPSAGPRSDRELAPSAGPPAGAPSGLSEEQHRGSEPGAHRNAGPPTYHRWSSLPEQWPARRAILAAVPVLTPDPKGRGPELSSRPRGHWTRPESPTCGPAGPAPPPGMSRRNHPESRLHVWF